MHCHGCLSLFQVEQQHGTLLTLMPTRRLQADAEYHQAVAKRTESALADQRSQTQAAQASSAKYSAMLADTQEKLHGAAIAAEEARQMARIQTHTAQARACHRCVRDEVCSQMLARRPVLLTTRNSAELLR